MSDEDEEDAINTEAANDKQEEEDHPWYNSMLLNMTEDERAEAKAWDEQRKRDYDAISAALDADESYGLTFEILLYAFDHLKSNPTASIEEAIGHGFCEWVK